MGIQIATPAAVPLPNDRAETYLAAIRRLVDPELQLVLTVFPQVRADRYAAVKKLCYVEAPVASQVCGRTGLPREEGKEVAVLATFFFCCCTFLSC